MCAAPAAHGASCTHPDTEPRARQPRPHCMPSGASGAGMGDFHMFMFFEARGSPPPAALWRGIRS